MLRHLGWTEAADLIIKGMEGAIAAKTVTYDFERLMDGAKIGGMHLVIRWCFLRGKRIDEVPGSPRHC